MRKMTGRLIVFEGPDGVGKTTLSKRTLEWLSTRGVKARYVSFPGCEDGSLGKLIYALHHNPGQFQCKDIDPTALQLLHVAAHIDALHKIIKPALAAGHHVVMDRCWWSMIVYGRLTAVGDESLRLMMELEGVHWANCIPSLVFLLDRPTPLRSEQLQEQYSHLRAAYSELAELESQKYNVHKISTIGPSDETFSEIASVLQGLLKQEKEKRIHWASQRQLPLASPGSVYRATVSSFSKVGPAVPTQVYDTYWQFAAKRQDIFFRRLQNLPPPWTDDPILLRFKFTNAYRASDRISQYLIKRVIYGGPQNPEDVFFRTLIFKIFNKIETWDLLEEAYGPLTCATFDLEAFDQILTKAMMQGQKIYSAAYIMPSGGKHGETKKHSNHLKLLKMMLSEGVPSRLAQIKKMRDAFELLRSYPMIGDFLAYQYVTDLNYSRLTDFSEMEFVVPGPGARDGIRKCFSSLGGFNEADIIKMVADRQNLEFEARGIDFKSLWGRPLQLIDCQNLFCEVDKYARYAHPDIAGITGRSRIKQLFRCNSSRIEYWYPPKWNLHDFAVKQQEPAIADA
jgi:thymidylate kinase